jgi:hypothetical protein
MWHYGLEIEHMIESLNAASEEGPGTADLHLPDNAQAAWCAEDGPELHIPVAVRHHFRSHAEPVPGPAHLQGSPLLRTGLSEPSRDLRAEMHR